MNVQNVTTSHAPNQLAVAQQFGGLPGVGNSGFNNGPQRGEPIVGRVGPPAFGGVTLNDFQPLLDLIRSTIDSDTWGDGDGSGSSSISPYPQNLSIVVSAPQETQDKVQALLEKLRELNDVQIVVEVRFVTLQDDFFERVGIDFDFQFEDNTGGVGVDPLNAVSYTHLTLPTIYSV